MLSESTHLAGWRGKVWTSFRSAELLQGHMVKALWPKVPADVYKRGEKTRCWREEKRGFHGRKLHLQPLDGISQRTRRTQSPHLFPLMKKQSELLSTNDFTAVCISTRSFNSSSLYLKFPNKKPSSCYKVAFLTRHFCSFTSGSRCMDLTSTVKRITASSTQCIRGKQRQQMVESTHIVGLVFLPPPPRPPPPSYPPPSPAVCCSGKRHSRAWSQHSNQIFGSTELIWERNSGTAHLWGWLLSLQSNINMWNL